MQAIAATIDAMNVKTGKALAWFCFIIVLIQFLVVIQRYVFGIGSVMLQESIIYMHGFMFMMASAYTLSQDGHVRVDIFYRSASEKTKAWVDMLGALFFLLPMCSVIFYVSLSYVGQSWGIMNGVWNFARAESSQETSGIPAVYLLKSTILIFAIQMALQAVSMILRSILVLRDRSRHNG